MIGRGGAGSPRRVATSARTGEDGSTVRYVVILLLLLVLALAGTVAGIVYFGITMEQIRDGVIIAYGLLGVLFFLIGIAVLLAVLAAVRAASGASGDVFNESVRPVANDAREMVGEVRGMVRTARGGVEFVTDNAVSPAIRVVAVARGFRRGLESVVRGRDGGGG